MTKRNGRRRTEAQDEQVLEGAIDIVFLLLIFFVLTSSFQMISGTNINPPKKIDAELVIDDFSDIILKIDTASQVEIIYKKQRYKVNNEILYQDGMKKLQRLLEENKEANVVVFADYESPFGVVNTVELICTELGISPYICYEKGQT